MHITTKYASKLFYYTIVALSLGLFAYEALTLFIQYRDQRTGYNKIEKVVDEIEMPGVTICVTDVFNNVETSTKGQDILKNLTNYTFSKEDIFYDLERLGKGLEIQETFHYGDGLCYTLTTSAKQINGESGKPPLILYLKNSLKYKVYVHEPGSELWLQASLKPTKIMSVNVDGSGMVENDLAQILVTLAKNEVTNVNREDYRCDPDRTLKSFTKCAFDYLRYKLKSNNCTSMVLQVNTSLEESNICQDVGEFRMAKIQEKELLERILVNSQYEACMKPCSKVEYIAAVSKSHKNSKILSRFPTLNDETISFGLFFNFEEFIVTEKKEYFILDETTLLSSVGGCLGMFLGFSTLTIADWIQSKLQK